MIPLLLPGYYIRIPSIYQYSIQYKQIQTVPYDQLYKYQVITSQRNVFWKKENHMDTSNSFLEYRRFLNDWLKRKITTKGTVGASYWWSCSSEPSATEIASLFHIHSKDKGKSIRCRNSKVKRNTFTNVRVNSNWKLLTKRTKIHSVLLITSYWRSCSTDQLGGGIWWCCFSPHWLLSGSADTAVAGLLGW